VGQAFFLMLALAGADSTQAITAGTPAPYSGILVPRDTLARMTTELEFKDRELELAVKDIEGRLTIERDQARARAVHFEQRADALEAKLSRTEITMWTAVAVVVVGSLVVAGLSLQDRLQ